jgi:hypothetical protein
MKIAPNRPEPERGGGVSATIGSLALCVRRSPRALIVPLVACGLALVLPPGCGGSNRPSSFADFVIMQPPAGDSGPAPIDLGGPPHVPMCNLGPNGGVCACADEPLLVDAPNIYFVLDRSGSMAALNKWANIQIVLEKLVIALGPRASVGAAVFPDPNSDGCTPGIQVFRPQRGDAPAGAPGPTAAALTTVLSRIPAAGGTPTALTLSSLLPTLRGLAGKTYVVLATDGGPNCNANAICTTSQCTYNIENDPGCPPGGPNCCTDPSIGADACLDAQPTISAVAAIASAGVPVYVVGVPGSAPYATLLDQLAVAGGTARTSEPLYYAIDSADQVAFLAALSGIAAQITGKCTLDLDNAPPEPGLVNVFFDEGVLPQAGPDGWTLDGTSVTVLGASCQKILDGNVLDVRVVAGCPTVTL